LSSVAVARPSAVIGRVDCGRDLERLMDNLHTGQGGAVVLFGEPGIGKTTLLAAMMAYAKTLRLCVVSARVERSATAGPLRERWYRLPDELEELSARTGVLLVIDDLHRIPGCLVSVLDALVELTLTRPILLAAAHRPRQLPVDVAAALYRASSSHPLSSHPIGPLTLAETQRMLADHPDVAGIHRDGQGNPAYMRMLAAASPVFADAAAAFSAELAQLSKAELRLAQVAAVMRDPFPPDLLVAVATADPSRTLAALDTLVAQDLIRPAEPVPLLAFRHPVVADVLYSGLSVSRRRATHSRIAAELARRDGPLSHRAFHIARAADPTDPTHVDTLLTAAREATAANPQASIDWMTVVLNLIPESDDRWGEAQLLLARARLLSGQPGASRDALHAVLAWQPAPNRPLTTAALVLASEVERMLGHFREAAAFANLATVATATPDDGGRLHLELAEHAVESLEFDVAARHASTAARHARRGDDRAGEVKALSLAALARFSHGDQAGAEVASGQAARRADAMSDAMLLHELSCLYQLAQVEAVLERLGDAERHLNRGLALCRQSGQSHILPAILKALGEIQLRLGRLACSVETLDEAAYLARASGDRPSRALTAALRANALVWLRAGTDTADAMAALDEATLACDGLDTGFAVVVRALVAETLNHAGEPERGARVALSAAGGRELPRLAAWRRPRYWDLLVSAEQRSGGDTAAADLYVRLASINVERSPSPLRLGYAGRADARTRGLHGHPDRAVESGEAAVEQFASRGARLEAARTSLVIAEVCLDNDVHNGTAGRLDRIAELATLCGSRRLAEQVTAARRRLGGPDRPLPDGLDQLTARESEVATMVSTGMTNSEIAGRLRLSVRTVDSHLWRVYHKLGVPNRASLTNLLARQHRSADLR